MTSTAKRVSETLGVMLDAIYDWESQVDEFMATGDDDADVVVTHDGRGRMLELSIRPGLQEELTAEELEDAVNEEIARNAERAYEGLSVISQKFLGNWAQIPEQVANNPVAAQFANALDAAGSAETNP